MSKINYSIIIPHKNLPDYLKVCLDSIPIRDDVEIIVVDDFSNPDIVDFENFPGHDRPNCKIVYCDKCYGSGHARNVGIENAQGKWLIFMDADDYFSDNIGELMDKYVDSEYDLVQFDFDAIKLQDGDIVPWERKNYYGRVLFHEKLTDREKCSETVETWAKFIRRDLVEKYHIRCSETKLCTGMIFSSSVALYSESPKVSVSDKFYVYVNRSNSAISKSSLESELDRLNVRCMQYNLLKGTELSNSMRTTQSYYMSSLSKFGFKAEMECLRRLAKCGLLFYTGSHINPLPMYKIIGAICVYSIRSAFVSLKSHQ